MAAEDAAHAQRVAAAAQWLKAHAAAPVALAKRTSNLFRDRAPGRREHLDLQALNHVLHTDVHAGWVEAEGSATYEQLVAWTLGLGMMPAVVPQLKTITLGGAAAGVGIEAASFREGLVHDTLLEIEVLLPHGEVVVARPDNEHADLFFGFPNSYGTLGYAVRLRARTRPVRPCVRVQHTRLRRPQTFFRALADACTSDADFVEGVAFGPDDFVLSVAHFVTQAPWRSDYTYMNVYWKSLRERRLDYLSAAGWLWRWDTDWFWCSRNFGAQVPLVRRLLGREHLNSRTYTRLMRLNARWQLAQRLDRWRGLSRESVIQDVDIPIDRAAEFLAFLVREIGILPIWACPLRGEVAGRHFPLYPLEPAGLYVNFGFWDVVQSSVPTEPGHYNRLIERQVARLGGIKSLYSDSYFTRAEFDAAYGMEQYAALKAKYDPQGRAPHLYDKTVRRA